MSLRRAACAEAALWREMNQVTAPAGGCAGLLARVCKRMAAVPAASFLNVSAAHS